ncbi:MAG: ABC transporter ATP-binding protein, partial [Roseburia sp.]|nr:ABC transporter ATP-binding protein [Roseburia sp.]
DIELLEVFYAHTISPIAIAVITSVVMSVFIGNVHPGLGFVAAGFYLVVGLVIPLVNGKRGSTNGQQYRNAFGDLNTCVLDNLYGLEETLQYQQKDNRSSNMKERTTHLEEINWKMKEDENTQRIVTDGVILLAGIAMAILAGKLAMSGEIAGYQAVIAVIAMMSSFGPTAALSALSNNLNHTLASGNRVLNLLEEEPVVEDVTKGAASCGEEIRCEQVSFSYQENISPAKKNPGEETSDGKTDFKSDGEEKQKGGKKGVLHDFNAAFTENGIHGILGKSGCGKSTLLKLLMRFYETKDGSIFYGKENVNHVNTGTLRSKISYVTQETFLFHDTIENNIKVAKADATREEVVAAAQKASIHDFIMTLPDGYDTKLAELGDSVSGGEKQRIGIARAFLHDSSMIFLDEPTSNIDSLNEGIILKSLKEEKADKTILLVSHRKSTMGICDDMLAM